MAGLRFDSLADMPEGMRKLAADKIVAGTVKEQTTAEFLVKKMNLPKYHNVETQVAGIRFASKKEARRYAYLCRCVELGVIEDLRLQVDFTLQEGYTTAKGERIRAIRYKADFTYKVKNAGYDHILQLDMADIEYWRGLYPGAVVIEDTKTRGTRTKEYKIKRKLMADKGYEVREV
jgi:hypothetical protein